MEFNKTNIDKIDPPALSAAGKPTRAFYYDDKLPQLGLTVTSSGSKSYHVRATVDGKTKRIGIRRGKFPGMTVAVARGKARSMLGDIEQGIDPVEKRRQERAEKATRAAVVPTLRSALTTYLGRKDYKQNTHLTYFGQVTNSFGDYMDRPVTDITEDVVKAANRKRQKAGAGAIRTLKALFNWLKAEYKAAGLFQGETLPTSSTN